jgi:hypothetical protein
VATVVGCSSSSSSPTGLAAALFATPRDATTVLFTDWAAFGHKASADGPAFAGNLVAYDQELAADLGFHSSDAVWEADVTRPGTGPATVLGFAGGTDLGAVEAKLATFGYAQTTVGSHDVLTGKDLSAATGTEHAWQQAMHVVAIDAKRHLLVAGFTAATVNAIFTSGQSLASRPDVRAVAQQVGHAVGAFVAVGEQACRPITALLGHGTPQVAALLRQRIAALGTFSPFTAEALAVPSPSADTGRAALAFPDGREARANARGRAAAPPVMNQLATGSVERNPGDRYQRHGRGADAGLADVVAARAAAGRANRVAGPGRVPVARTSNAGGRPPRIGSQPAPTLAKNSS